MFVKVMYNNYNSLSIDLCSQFVMCYGIKCIVIRIYSFV